MCEEYDCDEGPFLFAFGSLTWGVIGEVLISSWRGERGEQLVMNRLEALIERGRGVSNRNFGYDIRQALLASSCFWYCGETHISNGFFNTGGIIANEGLSNLRSFNTPPALCLGSGSSYFFRPFNFLAFRPFVEDDIRLLGDGQWQSCEASDRVTNLSLPRFLKPAHMHHLPNVAGSPSLLIRFELSGRWAGVGFTHYLLYLKMRSRAEGIE